MSSYIAFALWTTGLSLLALGYLPAALPLLTASALTWLFAADVSEDEDEEEEQP